MRGLGSRLRATQPARAPPTRASSIRLWLRVEAAARASTAGADVAGVDRGKRESRRAAGVRDRYPARGQLLPHRWIGLTRVSELDDVEVLAGRHG